MLLSFGSQILGRRIRFWVLLLSCAAIILVLDCVKLDRLSVLRIYYRARLHLASQDSEKSEIVMDWSRKVDAANEPTAVLDLFPDAPRSRKDDVTYCVVMWNKPWYVWANSKTSGITWFDVAAYMEHAGTPVPPREEALREINRISDAMTPERAKELEEKHRQIERLFREAP